MGKRLIWIVVLSLMVVSLVGIILIQVYWIKDSISNRRSRFSSSVKVALAQTARQIDEEEELDAYARYEAFLKDNSFRTKAKVNNYLYQQEDALGNKKFIYGTFLDEEFKIPTGLQMPDSTFIKKITSKTDFLVINVINNGKDFDNTFQQEHFSEIKRHTDYEKKQIAAIVRKQRLLMPIDERISINKLKETLLIELRSRGVNQKFDFGVYESGKATALKTKGFNLHIGENYSYPLFQGLTGIKSYCLYVTFPNENKSIYTSLYKILGVSLLFLLIIVSAFGFSLYQNLRQKKISKIKTDFINNMTHEFKTPIATIHLALDAIKNPKVIGDRDKVLRYIQMIRDENKRMHGQVEGVLRISKLDNNEINIKKETVDMIEVLEEAIEHVGLLIEEKKGRIELNFEALSTDVLGNQHHLISVVVNILENSIKYSTNLPEIYVYTSSTSKYFVLKIKDLGIGMSRQEQKNAFQKFYRAETGNVHNVKGHGLGLSYVKEVVENHQGTVNIESQKGVGSIFTVKLPLI